MPDTSPPSLGASVRAIVQGLANARDRQLADAVALLDALPDRGSADALIEPLRKRVAGLRPRRPLTFCRLLFSPLDPLIVPARGWRASAPTIPRTALPPLAETVRSVLGPEAGPIEALIKGHSIQDAATVAQAGERLWPQAGRILSDVPPPVRWNHTGLPLAAYPPMARRIGAVLSRLDALETLVIDAGLGRAPIDPDCVLAILRLASEQEPEAQPMMTTLLLARLPQASRMLGASTGEHGSRDDTTLREAGDQAMAVLLDQLEAPGTMATQLGRGDLVQSADQVRRWALLLREAEAIGPREQQARLRLLRRRLDEACRARFAAGLVADLVGKLVAPAPDPAMIDAWEHTARGLRAFETEARGLGGGSAYDALLREAADTVRDLPVRGAMRPVTRVRLVEILTGPESALAMVR